jgi:hypothetical protein
VREDGRVPARRLLWIVAVVSVVLVVAVGASYPGDSCQERVWSAALDGLTDRAPEPCAARAMDRVYAVSAGLMGLVLISGLLSRRD